MATFRDALHIVQAACLVMSVPGCTYSLIHDVEIALNELELAVDADAVNASAGEPWDLDSTPFLGPKGQAAYDKLRELLEAEGISPDALHT